MHIRAILRKKQAFSLIELVIACIVIGVLVSIAIPSYMNARFEADEAKAVATLYAYAQAQKAIWFEHQGTVADPHTYTAQITDLYAYVDVLSASGDDDGDWRYATNGDATSFTVTASHLDSFGAQDGHTLVIDQTGAIDDSNWPY